MGSLWLKLSNTARQSMSTHVHYSSTFCGLFLTCILASISMPLSRDSIQSVSVHLELQLNSPGMLEACGLCCPLDVPTVTANISHHCLEPLKGLVGSPAMFLVQPDMDDVNSHPGVNPMFPMMSSSALFAKNPDDTPVVIDSGASSSLALHLMDFVGPLEPAPMSEVTGLSGQTRVISKGLIEWTICNCWGAVSIIRMTACFAPDASIHLFSPQACFKEQREINPTDTRCSVLDDHKSQLHLPTGLVLEFPL